MKKLTMIILSAITLLWFGSAGAADLIVNGLDGRTYQNTNYDRLVITNSSNITIQNCNFAAATGAVVEIAGSTNIRIDNADIDGLTSACTGINTDANSHYIYIVDSDIHDIADDGAQLGGSHINFTGNKIYRLYGVGTEGTNGVGPCYNGHSDGIELVNVTDSEFSGNLIYDVRSNAAVFMLGAEYRCSNLVFKNNIFYTPESGFVFYIQNVNGIKAFNNVIWQGIWGGVTVGPNVADFYFYNNITHTIDYSHFSVPQIASEHHIDYNIIAKQYTYTLNSHDIVNIDPGFVNIPAIGGSNRRIVSADDFRLKNSSIAINNGTSGNDVPIKDFFGSARSGAPDVGAIEYINSDISALKNPRNLSIVSSSGGTITPPPDYTPTLSAVNISGQTQVSEGSSVQYTCTANFSDGSTAIVSDGVTWSEDSSAVSINNGGLLFAGNVTSDTSVIITATYNGLSDSLSLTVKAASTTLPSSSGGTNQASSLSQNGITWTFSRNVEYGEFANGDYFVLDNGSGVNIIDISPRSTSGGAALNGSMINPAASTLQGYDSRMTWHTYSAAANVALDVDSQNPLVLKAGESLVSSISRTPSPPTNYSYIDKMAVLTCLSTVPASGAFRPPFTGNNKSINFNENEIDYSVLANLPPGSGAPSITTLTGWFQFLQYDLGSNGGVWRAHRPYSQMPDYGADIAGRISQALLSLHCNYTNEQKRDLLVNMLQYSIDISALIENGAKWSANGGHGLGRKSVLALGARVFNNSKMKNQLNAMNYYIFGEDQHTFYISAADYSRTVCGYDNSHCGDSSYQYNSSTHPIGTAEWGHSHGAYQYGPNLDDARVEAPYRDYYSRQLGGLLSSVILGVESEWNWSAAFDYMERLRVWLGPPCTAGGPCYYRPSSWEISMFDQFWVQYRER